VSKIFSRFPLDTAPKKFKPPRCHFRVGERRGEEAPPSAAGKVRRPTAFRYPFIHRFLQVHLRAPPTASHFASSSPIGQSPWLFGFSGAASGAEVGGLVRGLLTAVRPLRAANLPPGGAACTCVSCHGVRGVAGDPEATVLPVLHPHVCSLVLVLFRWARKRF
jgi:hypothetical protein